MTRAKESNDTQRPDWVSQRAVAWVLDDAPCPAELVSTLVVIARRCDEHGKGSYQSNATMSRKTGKSTDQVHTDVKRLLELDLIRLGDQTLPAQNKVPEGRRPVVYDVNIGLRGEKPSRAGRNKTGKNKKGANAATPGTGTRGGMDTTGGTDTPGRGGMDTTPTPGMGTTQTKPLNNPMNNPSLSPHASSPAPAQRPPSAQERERDEGDSFIDPDTDDPRRDMVTKRGAPPHLADAVVQWIFDNNSIGGFGWWIKANGNGSLALQVKAALEALAAGPVCETCDGTRTVTGRNTYDQPTMHDCPACTPLTDEARKSFARSVQGHPPCPHHQPGGNVPMPGRGWMACATCRNLSGYVPTEFRDQQPRSSQRGGYVAPKVNLPPGQREASWERRRQAAGMDVAPGHVRRPDGTTILKNSRDPEIDWEADF